MRMVWVTVRFLSPIPHSHPRRRGNASCVWSSFSWHHCLLLGFLILGRLQLLTIYCETSNVVGVGKIHSEKANKEAYMICWKANTSNFKSITWKYMSKRLHFSIIFLVHKYLQSTFCISSTFLVAWEMLVINKLEWLPLGNVSGG